MCPCINLPLSSSCVSSCFSASQNEFCLHFWFCTKTSTFIFHQMNDFSCWCIFAGYYCLTNATDYSSNPCPAGHYCPNGTTKGDDFSCPAGTFNPVLTQSSITACLPCTPGMHCLSQGLSSPTANCTQGYYCIGGAKEASPTNSSQGGRCKRGTYCPAGSKNYTECDGGKYCELEGMAAPSGNCSPGEILFIFKRFFLHY